MKQEALSTIETLTDCQARHCTQAFGTHIQNKRASEHRFTSHRVFEYPSIRNERRWLHSVQKKRLTLAFSCGARSASELEARYRAVSCKALFGGTGAAGDIDSVWRIMNKNLSPPIV